MRIRDKHGRTWFVCNRYKLHLLGLCIEQTEGTIYGIIVGWDARWLSRQKKLKQCQKCKRFVPSPCNSADGYHAEGPWDFLCHDFFNPASSYWR